MRNTPQNEILIDAGPLIALFDRHDNYHHAVAKFLVGTHYHFVSTIAVLTEVSHMLDFNINAQLDFFTWVMKNGVRIVDITQDDIARIVELITKYSDRPMDFADATLVVASEKNALMHIISIDSDFDIYRLPGKRLIENVFRPKG
jgi:predicted nucleic acid-binding protein